MKVKKNILPAVFIWVFDQNGPKLRFPKKYTQIEIYLQKDL